MAKVTLISPQKESARKTEKRESALKWLARKIPEALWHAEIKINATRAEES